MKGTLLAVFLAVFTALGIAADAAAQECRRCRAPRPRRGRASCSWWKRPRRRAA